MSGWVTQGPRVHAFEEAFARSVGAAHACAVSSCTAALHLALVAVGVKPGDVVATVSHSFIATANAIRQCGAEPVFVDVRPSEPNMDPEALARLLTQDCLTIGDRLYYRRLNRLTSQESALLPFKQLRQIDGPQQGRMAAIVAVHQMGLPCDIGRIVDIARSFNIPVVEDAACALGSEISSDGGRSWEALGRPHGDVACFSFHPRKVLTTGDGGMLTTAHRKHDETFRLLRHHGMAIADTVRHQSAVILFEDYPRTGFNYRMTDIQAAIGLVQLRKLTALVAERRRLAARYAELLEGTSHVTVLRGRPAVRPNWQSYPVIVGPQAPCTPKDLMQMLLDRGIATRRGIMNAHQEAPYLAGWTLPQSEKWRDRVILLPLFPGLAADDQIRIAGALKAVLATNGRPGIKGNRVR